MYVQKGSIKVKVDSSLYNLLPGDVLIIRKNTPYQYWLAKSFVLLSDIYVAQNDDFQAKQYLISLRDNYTAQDSIQDLIKDRLDKIIAREKTQSEE